jgi:hypothetical protein
VPQRLSPTWIETISQKMRHGYACCLILNTRRPLFPNFTVGNLYSYQKVAVNTHSLSL